MTPARILVYHYVGRDGASTYSAAYPGRPSEATHARDLATAVGALLLASPPEGLTIARDDTRDCLSRLTASEALSR